MGPALGRQGKAQGCFLTLSRTRKERGFGVRAALDEAHPELRGRLPDLLPGEAAKRSSHHKGRLQALSKDTGTPSLAASTMVVQRVHQDRHIELELGSKGLGFGMLRSRQFVFQDVAGASHQVLEAVDGLHHGSEKKRGGVSARPAGSRAVASTWCVNTDFWLMQNVKAAISWHHKTAGDKEYKTAGSKSTRL